MGSIDFATLTLVDALDLAILIEEEARERYEEFADQMEVHHGSATADFFRFMAGNERKHGETLAERRVQLFPEAPAVVSRSMLWEEEAPSYDAVRVFMTPRQALNVALSAERKAQSFFAGALPHLLDPQVKELFLELHAEELEHEAFVLKQLERLPPDPDLDIEDFVDEPVAQE